MSAQHNNNRESRRPLPLGRGRQTTAIAPGRFKERLEISFREWADGYYIERDYSTLAKLAKIGDQAGRLLIINQQRDVANDWTALYMLTTLDDNQIAQIEGPISQRTFKNVHVANNSGNDEWYTPKEYVDSARKVMGSIDTDPASCKTAQAWIKSGIYYDEKSDGLKQKWSGNVWLNPPYSQPLIANFSEALCIRHAAAKHPSRITSRRSRDRGPWLP